MREIKFRQPLLNRDMTFNKFHYWGIMTDSFVGREMSGREKGDDQQFTGLLDKNGKEIYEGDILKTSTGNYPVIWDNDGLWGFDDRHPLYFSDINQREVIGNIYESPHLLDNNSKL